ncbi:Uncharacterized protein dnm_055610 [Desulfonema magnum]|uniref:Uncharacterized protein n=1 Tax=Desulfonema magnum TaxID=45655 RepID=A0A975GQ45_9BACT|nr:Uncharacterized protein dnm_055610 [Desulfonema magnum]
MLIKKPGSLSPVMETFSDKKPGFSGIYFYGKKYQTNNLFKNIFLR